MFRIFRTIHKIQSIFFQSNRWKTSITIRTYSVTEYETMKYFVRGMRIHEALLPFGCVVWLCSCRPHYYRTECYVRC